jgi:hypothetical protein
MAKRIVEASVAQLTVDGAFHYPWANKHEGQATFTSSFNTCYFAGNTYKKVKGGQNGGNYCGEHDGEIYRIWQRKA